MPLDLRPYDPAGDLAARHEHALAVLGAEWAQAFDPGVPCGDDIERRARIAKAWRDSSAGIRSRLKGQAKRRAQRLAAKAKR